MIAAALAAAVAVALVVPGRTARRRLTGRPGGLSSGQRLLPARWRATAVPPAARRTHRLAAGVAAGGVLLVFGLPAGPVLAPLVFLAVPVGLSRLEPAAVRRRSARTVADLPLAVDLLAACLRAGRPPGDAIGLVGDALGGPLAELLAKARHRLDLGADPIDAWGVLLEESACAPLARAVQRALRSGAPLARTLDHLADDLRQDRRWTADELARAVETRSVVPLGLCFLPAFVLIGVVPIIAGSLSGVLTVIGG